MAYKAKEKEVLITYLQCCGGRSNQKKNNGFFNVPYDIEKGNILVKEQMNIPEETAKILGIKSIIVPYLITFDKKGKAETLVVSLDQIFNLINANKDKLDINESDKCNSLEEFLNYFVKGNKKYSISRIYTEKPALMVDLRNPNLLHTLEPLPFREIEDLITLIQARQGIGYNPYPSKYNMVGKHYREEVKIYCSLSMSKFERFFKDHLLARLFKPLIRLIAGKKFKQYKLHKYLYENITKNEKTTNSSQIEYKTQDDCDFDFINAVENISGKRVVSNGYIGTLNVRVHTKEQYGKFVYQIEGSIDDVDDTKGLGVETEYTDKTAKDFLFYGKKEIENIINKSKKIITRPSYEFEITVEINK